jgi:hypothetical protein
MFVWPDGQVTGSVHAEALEEFRRALAEGDPLDPRCIPDGLTEADYPRPEKPEPEADLSALKKAELVEKAEAAGIDTTGATKADIVAALQEGE